MDSALQGAREKSGFCSAPGRGENIAVCYLFSRQNPKRRLQIGLFPLKLVSNVHLPASAGTSRQCWLLTHAHTCTLTALAARIFSWGRAWLQSRASPGRSGVQAACGSCYRNGSLARQVPDSRTRKHTYREAVWCPGGSVDPGLRERPGFSPDPARARVPLGKSLH